MMIGRSSSAAFHARSSVSIVSLSASTSCSGLSPAMRCTSTRVRSTWRKKRSPSPAPSCAPSIRPGTSTITNDSNSADADHTELRLERGERIVGDLRTRRAHHREQRRLPGVRQADHAGIGEQLQLEPQLAVFARLALLGEARRLARGGREVLVALTAAPALARRARVRRRCSDRRTGASAACFLRRRPRCASPACRPARGSSISLPAGPALLF